MLMAPVQGLTAEYLLVPNGTAYNTRVEITGADRYTFSETGPLGERISLKVSNVTLIGDCDPCPFTWEGNTITFEKGNYTVSFQGPVRDNHLLLTFEEPYRVLIVLPEGLKVQNLLLGFISPGGRVIPAGNETQVIWNSTRSAEVRFYDSGREELLYLFGSFWVLVAVLMLLPFALTWRKKE